MLGDGYVGVEFASIQAAFGTRVTMLQRSQRLLTREDPDISTEIETLLREAGVRVLTGVTAQQVDDDGDRVRVAFQAHDAQEVINTVAVAMRLGETATGLRDGIYTHPSMTEALNDFFANLT